ncbi:hypothetical protein ACRWUU_25275, partial [Escherichia coli]
WGISPRQPSGKNIIRWLLKKRTNGSVRYCQYTSVRMLSVPASSCRLVGTLGMLFLFTLAIPVQAAERRGLGRAG